MSEHIRIFCNGEARSVAADVTIAALLTELRLEPKHVAVELNLQLVPRTQHASQRLVEGDRLEIVTLAGGG